MATDDLGSMLVSFEASLDGLLTGQQQFTASIDAMLSSADKMSSSLGELAPLDAGKLVEDVSGAEDQFANIGQAAIQMEGELGNLAPYDVGKAVTGEDVAQAKLTLIETKVQEARDKLQTLQDAADAGKAVTGIDAAQANLTLLEAKAQEARASLKDLQSGSEETGNDLGEGGGFGHGLMEGVSSLLEFGAHLRESVLGLKELATSAIETGISLLEPAANNERLQNSFETLLHSTSAAHQEIQSLSEYASHTPMQTEWVDTAAEKMLAFGFNVRDVQPDITAIGDSLSGLGKLSDASLSSIVDIFGKIRAQGKLTGGDMMQLSTWGIPAWNALSESMHKPIPELQKMVSAGLVPADTAIKGLTQGMEKTFGGDMAKQANTFNGLMSTLASNWNMAVAAFGSPLLKYAEQAMGNIANTLSSQGFKDFASGVGQKIADVFGKIADFAEKNVVPAVKDILKYLQSDDFAGVIADFQSLGNQLERSIEPAFKAIAPLAKDLFANLGPVLKNDIIPSVDNFVFDLSQLVEYFNENHDAAQTLGAVLLGVGAGLAAIKIAQFLQMLPELIAGLTTWASELAVIDIEELIAAWPFVLLGIVVAAVVAGIIIAIQHWGEISKWLTDRWKDVSKFFEGIWHNIQGFFGNIGKWFQDRFNEAKKGIENGLKGAGDGVKNTGKSIEDNWNTTVNNILKGTQWLYDHNTYFKKFIDDSVKFFNDLKRDLGKTWDDIQKRFDDAGKAVQHTTDTVAGFLHNTWTTVSNFIGDKWKWISDRATEASNFVSAQWQKGVNFVSDQWHGFERNVSQIWSNISGVFSSAWDRYIGGPMGNLWNRFTGWWNNLISQAGTIGGQIIQSITDGIWAGIGNIGNAIHGAVSNALAGLGFHDIPGFAVGTNSAPGGLAMVGENGPELVNLPRGAQVIPLQGNSIRSLAAATSAMNTSSSDADENHFHIYIGNEQLVDYVANKQARDIRLKTGRRYAS